ncbi:NERD domain-containing protein [Actinobacillus equuli]|uniref:NERD domain-containing protein n=1 Tax=Actinobacillus equuli TaxID=718 RepID=UPI00244151FD|nr:hypothetical protein [Actinobacillus equuli]WGE60049.1 hypothetical protein NYR73_04900 [Actinobacillus equuli subsp. haemolyticus]WGE61304.1 hypothetical protein NYR74_00535 [Actinobacillus equuli subsp. haemolyticus]
MNPRRHDKLLSEIKDLKNLTKFLSIKDIVNFINSEHRKFLERDYPSRDCLSSPLRQSMYLLGISASQKEPSIPIELDFEIYHNIINKLNSIFDNYPLAYIDAIDKSSGIKNQNNLVSMSTFLHYFMSGMKIDTIQMKKWIRYYFGGFEDKIKCYFGLDHHEFPEIAQFIEDKTESNLIEIQKNFETIERERQRFLEALSSNFELAISEIKGNIKLQENVENFLIGINDLFVLKYSDIESKFGSNAAKIILDFFTTKRGDSLEITYLTDLNPVIFKPFITVDDENLLFVLNHSFYQSLIYNFEKFFKESPYYDSFRKARDNRLEKSVTEQFRRIFTNSILLESVFENDKSQFEHDLVIIDEKNLLIVESKAAPFREPLRDPEKAFQRIRDDFRKSSGIQKAYNQSMSLKKKLKSEGECNLYDKKGNFVTKLNYKDFNEIYCICITRDDFGSIATNLSSLLEKEDDESYPFVIDILSLETLFTGLLYLNMNKNDFLRYISQRKELHGKVFGSDELEFAGQFLNYGGLEHYSNLGDREIAMLTFSDSRVFDNIFYAMNLDIPYNHTVKKPDIFELIARDESKKQSNFSSKKKKLRKMKEKSKRKNRK